PLVLACYVWAAANPTPWSSLAYVTNGARAALDAWLTVRGAEPGPLFVPIDKAGRVQPRGMTTQAIYLWHAGQAWRGGGIEHFSPHDLRRSFVGDMLDAGADESLVQQLAGHANRGSASSITSEPPVSGIGPIGSPCQRSVPGLATMRRQPSDTSPS